MTDAREEQELRLIAGRRCLDFVNTLRGRIRDQPVEHLRQYTDFIRWSLAAGNLAQQEAQALTSMADADAISAAIVVRRAIELREALYRVFATLLISDRPDASDLATLNAELERVSPHLCCLRWTDSGPALGWSTALTLDRPLWNVVRSTIELLVSDQRALVKQCEEETCSWLFIDETRNHSRRWCDMTVCGNRAKARRFRARRRRTAARA